MTDEDTGKFEECLMDVRAPFIASAQPSQVVQPGEAAFHNPTAFAQSTAMLYTPFGQKSLDATLSQLLAMQLRIVSSVALHGFGAMARATSFALHRLQRFEIQRNRSRLCGDGHERARWYEFIRIRLVSELTARQLLQAALKEAPHHWPVAGEHPPPDFYKFACNESDFLRLAVRHSCSDSFKRYLLSIGGRTHEGIQCPWKRGDGCRAVAEGCPAGGTASAAEHNVQSPCRDTWRVEPMKQSTNFKERTGSLS